MKRSILLGKIAGIEIGVHYSWFAVLALVSWNLAGRLFPDEFAGWSMPAYWTAGVIAALLLFASVLVHELAHSLVAQARGFRVEGITLFLLGGVSNLKADARRPRDEFAISVVGPLTSVLLAALLGAALLAFRQQGPQSAEVWFLATINVSNSPAAALVWYLAWINLLLAAFNLLPAFPLDGGRVLRSVLWATTGSFARATRVAARGGQAFGLLAIGIGVLEIAFLGYLGGLWLVIVGWFLYGAAAAARREAATGSDLRGTRVGDVMDTHPATIGPDESIAEAVFGHFLRPGVGSLPVSEGGRLVGIITLTDVRSVPREIWSSVTVGERMTAMPLKQVTPDDDLSYALDLLARHSIGQAPVFERGRFVGLLSSAQIGPYLRRRAELPIA